MGEVSPKVTERASPERQSRSTAISRLFVRAILSLCLCSSDSILALSVSHSLASSPKGGATGVSVRFTLDE